MRSSRSRLLARLVMVLVAGLLITGCEPNRVPAVPPAGNGFDFPDPDITHDGTRFYAYRTNDYRNLPVRTSTNLRDWREVRDDAMPHLPAWTRKGKVWAPTVERRSDGRYVLFYTTVETRTGTQCISRAVADRPTGPFRDRSSGPLVCQRNRGGSIDPDLVVENGAAWLIWKSEGVVGSEPPIIWSQRLDRNWTGLVGSPRALIRQDQAWEFPIIENPTMISDAHRWYLLYSGNRWETARYATGYAVCDSPLGPCRKPINRPLIESTGPMAGPGGAALFRGPDGRRWVAFHAWTAGRVGYPRGDRSLRVAEFGTCDGYPQVTAPVDGWRRAGCGR